MLLKYFELLVCTFQFLVIVLAANNNIILSVRIEIVKGTVVRSIAERGSLSFSFYKLK